MQIISSELTYQSINRALWSMKCSHKAYLLINVYVICHQRSKWLHPQRMMNRVKFFSKQNMNVVCMVVRCWSNCLLPSDPIIWNQPWKRKIIPLCFVFTRSNDLYNASNIQAIKDRIKKAKNIVVISNISQVKSLIISFMDSDMDKINWIVSTPESHYSENFLVPKGKKIWNNPRIEKKLYFQFIFH